MARVARPSMIAVCILISLGGLSCPQLGFDQGSGVSSESPPESAMNTVQTGLGVQPMGESVAGAVDKEHDSQHPEQGPGEAEPLERPDPVETPPAPELLDNAALSAQTAPEFVAPVAEEVIEPVADPTLSAAVDTIATPDMEPVATDISDDVVQQDGAEGESDKATHRAEGTARIARAVENGENDEKGGRRAGSESERIAQIAAENALENPLEDTPAKDDSKDLPTFSDPSAAHRAAPWQPVDDVPMLAATRKETWVFDKPNWNARRIGYLRAGAVVGRQLEPSGYKGCKQGWYRIEPEGYVCVGKSASLDTANPVVQAGFVRPDRSRPMPYAYVMSQSPPPPLYVRLPSVDEQRKVEGDVQKFRNRSQNLRVFEPLLQPVPPSLVDGQSLPSPYASARPTDALFLGRPAARSGFGLLHVFSWTERMFGVTTDLHVIPLDRMKPIEGSSMQGLHLVEDMDLPIAFVQSRYAHLYRIDVDSRAVQNAGAIGYREGFSLTGRRVRVGEHVYLETRDGTFIRENNRVVVLPTIKTFPSWATPGRKWISVSITRQALVAFEGTRPVFATLVSTGADGLGDPKETFSTIQGAFVIHTKHVTKTMSSDEEGDVYDLQDVPYVQYFHEGYALHASYWHDGFGTPRSHGCINLAPYDAAWLFAWTEPRVPEGWHGKLQLKGGTLIHIHP